MTSTSRGSTPAPSPKGAQTRSAIVESAMRLFRRDGYDATTMRAIAAEAGVSLGNAYYYFGSKEHLVQAFYDQLQVEHRKAATGALERQGDFASRLRGVLQAWVEVAAPSHAFAGQFFRNAADPASPLSPFSQESADARLASIDLYRDLVVGSDLKLAKALREDLPELLWLLHMGVVLFWVYDASPDQERTRLLVDRMVPIVDRLSRLSRLPVVKGAIDDLLGLVAALRV